MTGTCLSRIVRTVRLSRTAGSRHGDIINIRQGLRQGRSFLSRPEALEIVLVSAASTVWLLYLTPASGGFHDPATAVMAAAAVPALIAVRPWRTVPSWCVALTALSAAAALVVLQTGAPGWSQADAPAGQLLGLIALVATAGFARTPSRRRAVCACAAAGVVTEFLPAWKAWQGSGDPNTLMGGTFYWHNQLGLWMTALGLLAAAYALNGRLRWARWVAGGLSAVATACTVLSTARTDLALLVVGYLILLPLSVRGRGRLQQLAVWAALPAASVLLLLFLTSSLFFSTSWSGVSALQSSSDTAAVAGDRGTSSLEHNGGDRVRFDKAAVHSWSRHPVLGNGFGSFRYTVVDDVPVGDTISAFTHNGYLEALTSGGLVFAIPFIGVWLGVAWAAVRQLVQCLRRGAARDPLCGAALAVGVLLAHSAVDFDWHYSSLLVLLGVLGGVLIGSQERQPVNRGRIALVAAGLTFVVAVTMAASLAEHHGRQVTQQAQGKSAQQLLDSRWWGTDDMRIDTAALDACWSNGRLTCPPEVARRAVDATAKAATLDPEVRTVRRQVLAAMRHT